MIRINLGKAQFLAIILSKLSGLRHRFLSGKNRSPEDRSRLNSSVIERPQLKRAPAREFLKSQNQEYIEPRLVKCAEQRQLARSVIRSRRGKGSLCEFDPLGLIKKEDEITPYSAASSIHENLHKTHKRHKTAIMSKRGSTGMENSSHIVQKIYKPQLKNLKVEISRINAKPSQKPAVRLPCKTSLQRYTAYYCNNPIVMPQNIRSNLKQIMNRRAKSCARGASMKDPLVQASPLERTELSAIENEYSGGWKQTNSTDLTGGPSNFIYPKCTSIQIQTNVLSINPPKERHSESLDFNFGSRTNLSTPPRYNSSMQYPGESVEEIHYFFVAFHQRAKSMLRRLETGKDKAIQSLGKTIVSINNEDTEGL